MTTAPQCDECRALLEEFRDALREMSPEVTERFWSAREAFLKLIGGTEEDLEHLEESADKYQFRQPSAGSLPARDGYGSKIQSALGKMFAHCFRSGHRFPFYR